MTAYLSGSSSTIVFDLIYEDGSLIDAQSISYRLFDKDNVQLVAETVVNDFVVGDATAVITIVGTNNVLGVSELSSVRKLTALVTTETGSIVPLDQTYIIRSSNQLSFMVNSYQTIQEAELTAFNIPNLDAFESASQIAKTSALKEAFVRLGMMTYSVDYNYLGGSLDYVTEANTMSSGSPVSNLGRRSVIVNKINLLSLSQVSGFPKDFIAKLKVAQVLEADYILGNGASDARIVSQKVGESTTSWAHTSALALHVSKRALEALTGYLHYGAHLGRG